MLGLQPPSLGSTNPNGLFGANTNSLFGASTGLGVSAADPTQQMMSQMTEQMSQLMQALLGMLSQGQGLASGGGSFGGGDSGASSGVSDFLGGSSPAGSTGSVGGDAAGAGGQNAAEIAKKYLGQKSGDLGNMANFTRGGQADNNCAEFVSACLANAGVYKKKPGDASVRVLKQHLIEDGWKKVSKEQTKPGDVAIFNGNQHVELVAEAGGKQLIGSNNKGGGNVQTVSMDSGNWGSVEYYSKG